MLSKFFIPSLNVIQLLLTSLLIEQWYLFFQNKRLKNEFIDDIADIRNKIILWI